MTGLSEVQKVPVKQACFKRHFVPECNDSVLDESTEMNHLSWKINGDKKFKKAIRDLKDKYIFSELWFVENVTSHTLYQFCLALIGWIWYYPASALHLNQFCTGEKSAVLNQLMPGIVKNILPISKIIFSLNHLWNIIEGEMLIRCQVFSEHQIL